MYKQYLKISALIVVFSLGGVVFYHGGGSLPQQAETTEMACDANPKLTTTTHYIGQESFPYKLTGFSGPEGSHRWTEGSQATMLIPREQGDQRLVRVTFKDTKALITEVHPVEQLTVSIGGPPINQYTYNSCAGTNSNTINIDIPRRFPSDNVLIRFDIKNPASPDELGLGNDHRKLGVFFNEMTLTWAQKCDRGRRGWRR